MLCVSKMLFWWPLNTTIPSDDAEWLSFIPRPSLKNSKALGYVIGPVMQLYLLQAVEEEQAATHWMSIVTFCQTIFTLCICNIFLLKNPKDVYKGVQRTSNTSNCWEGGMCIYVYVCVCVLGGGRGRGVRLLGIIIKVFKSKLSPMVMTMRTYFKLDCSTCQVPHFMYKSVTLLKPSYSQKVTLLLSQLSVYAYHVRMFPPPHLCKPGPVGW